MDLTFYGVRGSCPCPSEHNLRYGGNTACVALTAEGENPIIFDLGTGLRAFGDTQPLDGSFAGTALVTHIHWDHVQGLPFFPPADRTGARLSIYGPQQDEGSLGELIDDFMRPPYFPVKVGELRGEYTFHEVLKDEVRIGAAEVTVRPVPHVGPTVGYRVRWHDRVVTYISDHQAPLDLESIGEPVLELADSADVLIHDAQYTPDEFAEKSHWGHCTIDYAIRVAREAKVQTLVLFHHDPGHADDRMDEILADARAASGPRGPEILAAYEGLRIRL
ncbi:MAG TPA: MBL fold metallo-hydrolase [Acidimicrobiales bacterium]|nr:MBL fold metallo-hydrolase [Acidimicrobiales bacterium]